MNKPFFLVNSITYAMKGRDLLAKHGIYASVERSQSAKERYGCGYGILVPRRTEEAAGLLHRNHISVLERMERP